MIITEKIQQLIKKYNLSGVKKSGNDNIVCHCPFHNDSNASFALNIKTGAFICYSSNCGKKGDFYYFISLMEGCTIEEAKKSLFGNNENSKYYAIINDIENCINLKHEKLNLDNKKTKLYFKNFFKFSDYDKYLKKLNISEQVAKIAKFKICVGPKYYYSRLAIPISEDLYELRDLSGKSDKKVLYTSGSKVSHIIYTGASDFSKNKSCFLVEGTKDVLTINSFGYNALCCFGTNISQEQIRLIIKCGINKIMMLYDGDSAGIEASKKNYKTISKYFDLVWLKCKFGKDPNDLTIEEFNSIIT